jgi:hypothetical protein
MKVIGAGFGRTGTLSLKVALEELGFGPCYHMTELINRPRHVAFWRRALDRKPVDWRTFFQPYGATVDWPGCTFYQELMAVYPEAKVLLTVREPSKWYNSTEQTIYSVQESIPHWLHFLLALVSGNFQLADQLIWQGTFHGRFADRAYALEIFQQHIAEVKQVVPAERLLVYQVQEGWEPLCRFLGVPVPEGKPFPHLNDTMQFQQAVRQRVRLATMITLGLSMVGFILLVALVYFWLG